MSAADRSAAQRARAARLTSSSVVADGLRDKETTQVDWMRPFALVLQGWECDPTDQSRSAEGTSAYIDCAYEDALRGLPAASRLLLRTLSDAGLRSGLRSS